MPSSQTLTGFVYDAAGKAVSSAEVRLYRAGTTTSALSSTVTNAAGKWTFALSSGDVAGYDAGAVDLDVQITNAATGVVGRVKFEDQVQVERVLARQFLLSPDSNGSSGNANRGFFHRLTGTAELGAEKTHTLPKFTGTVLMGTSQDSNGAFVLGDSQAVTSSAAASFKKLTTTSSLEVTGGGVKVNTNKFTTDSDGNTVIAGTLTTSTDGAGTDVTFYSATAGDNFTWDASAKKLIITGTDNTDAFAVADGDATFADDVTIGGDLTVNGTTTTINSTITTYSDVLVKLGQGTTASPAVDLGFIFTRGNGSASDIANRAMLWDESADQFVFAFTNDEAGTTTGNVDIDDYADLRVGAITADDASTFTSKITADAGIDIDNINIDGTTIALSTGDLTLDVAGDIVLDADGDDVSLQAGGSYPLTFTQSASGVWVLKNTTSDKGFTIAGNDGGSNVNALVFDMSDAGKATFSGDVVVTGDVTISGDDLTMATNTSGAALIGDGTNFNPVVISGAISIGTSGTATIANDALDSQHYAAGSIDNEHLADDAVDTDEIAAAAVDFANIQNVAANSILGRNANSSGVLSEVALATTQILIGDGTGFTAAALSGDATMTNAGVVSLAAGAVDTAHIGDNQVTLAKMAGLVRGKVIYGDASGDPAALAVGTAGYVLGTDNTDLAYTNSLLAADYVIGEDADTKIDFETADEIHFDAAGTERVVIDSTGLTIKSGSLETATIDFTDGDLAMTIADGGGVTFSQDVTLASGKGIVLDSLPDSDNHFSGFFGAFANATGSTISQGAVVYHTGTANQVALARANADSTMPAIAIATADVANGASGNFLLMGMCYDASLAALTIGGEVYVSEDTAGAVTATLPASNGDRVQVVGIGMHADKMIFNPDYTIVERSG